MGETKGDNSRISRRDFFKKTGKFGAGILASAFSIGGGEWLMSPSDVWPKLEVIEKEKNDDLGLGELGKDRSEFFTVWPRARVWVVINNVLAAAKLDGKVFKKGEEYSLIDLMKLSESRNNLDPRAGYISGIALKKQLPFAYLVDSQGLCLTSVCFGRALACSPVEIREWHSHVSLDEVTMNYVKKENQIVSDPVFSELGTDVAIYTSSGYKNDFRFAPFEDLKLRCKVMDARGRALGLSDFDQLLEILKAEVGGYPASLTRRLPSPIMVRYALGSKSMGDYQITLNSAVKDAGVGTMIPGWKRSVGKDGQVLCQENFFASYDQYGKSV